MRRAGRWRQLQSLCCHGIKRLNQAAAGEVMIRFGALPIPALVHFWGGLVYQFTAAHYCGAKKKPLVQSGGLVFCL